ncbi:uncharacterized protein LOC114936336 [Nylanderia fulva]|uniref:uncharacterized protein LOC114936336 n=1 Tax=Nylanderia fulva TaxID=613905 RepID=UPI0010FBBB1B|nr:uncharacterized protein LOC114936336 [Nylanderia fulva]
MELSAIVLLTKLLEWVQNSLNLQKAPVYGWTDSSVALAWLQGHPSRWKTFVANRVSEVQTQLPSVQWNHVSSSDNPADCASRGVSPAAFRDFTLWWHGPAWLSSTESAWPIHNHNQNRPDANREIVESEIKLSSVCHTRVSSEWELPHIVSSWTKLIRVTALVKRFIQKLKREFTAPKTTELSAVELKEASLFWLRYVQLHQFPSEIKVLNAKGSIPKSSSLSTLCPFLGEDKLIRLGGRIESSPLSFNERHPIILPKHRISDLLIAHAHKAALHGGTQLTLRILRQNYWIISARTSVKSHIHNCVRCVRKRARPSQQLMGNLPVHRVNPSPPFTHTGVDYAGPMSIIPVVGRGQKSRKYYVVVFICLATKAVHLEYVDDYTTAGFLAAFKRFASRRGLPSDIYSDNGTNFQGVDRELYSVFQRLIADPELKNTVANDNVKWHFIPPAAPHFGGLWEAGVKGLKFHLKRVTGSRTLSQIEFATLLCFRLVRKPRSPAIPPLPPKCCASGRTQAALTFPRQSWVGRDGHAWLPEGHSPEGLPKGQCPEGTTRVGRRGRSDIFEAGLNGEWEVAWCWSESVLSSQRPCDLPSSGRSDVSESGPRIAEKARRGYPRAGRLRHESLKRPWVACRNLRKRKAIRSRSRNNSASTPEDSNLSNTLTDPYDSLEEGKRNNSVFRSHTKLLDAVITHKIEDNNQQQQDDLQEQILQISQSAQMQQILLKGNKEALPSTSSIPGA